MPVCGPKPYRRPSTNCQRQRWWASLPYSEPGLVYRLGVEVVKPQLVVGDKPVPTTGELDEPAPHVDIPVQELAAPTVYPKVRWAVDSIERLHQLMCLLPIGRHLDVHHQRHGRERLAELHESHDVIEMIASALARALQHDLIMHRQQEVEAV